MSELKPIFEEIRFEDFILNSALYLKYKITDRNKFNTDILMYNLSYLDCYCIDCNSQSVFNPVKNDDLILNIKKHNYFPYTPDDKSIERYNRNKIFQIDFQCSRDCDHQISIIIQVKEGEIYKIGQFPPLADIVNHEIKKYRKILGEKYYDEYSKAIGLFSHGIGVGSYVYLRRIIENFIIEPAHQELKAAPNWDENSYNKARIKEKIDLLKSNLPDFLVQNQNIYSVLSIGIHELSEEKCKEYFPILKNCLEFILTDIQAKKEIEQKKKEVQNSLNKLSQNLK